LTAVGVLDIVIGALGFVYRGIDPFMAFFVLDSVLLLSDAAMAPGNRAVARPR